MNWGWRRCLGLVCLLHLMLAASDVTADDWPRFLGPRGEAVDMDAQVPTEWSADRNVVWKAELPGPGTSSPILLGDRIFLTCYSGYGVSERDPGEQENLLHHVVCLDRSSGEVVWERRSKPRLPEQEYRGFIALHGYASATPVTDGRYVYTFFGRSGVWAYGIDGSLKWSIGVGENTHGWGSAASPILHRDMVIVNASVESKRIVALDKTTGKLVWQVPGIRDSWSTPLIVELPDGSSELVVSMHSKIIGVDPNSGEVLWHCLGVEDYVCPSVIAEGDVAYVTGGRGAAVVIAVRCGGRGDVNETHRLWELRQTPKVSTPVVHDGLMYWVGHRGIAHCVDTGNGELVYRERVGGLGTVYGSTVLAGGKLIAFSREKGAVVFAPGRQYEELARNDLGDKSIFNATPAIDGNRLLIRSDRYLYCLGE